MPRRAGPGEHERHFRPPRHIHRRRERLREMRDIDEIDDARRALQVVGGGVEVVERGCGGGDTIRLFQRQQAAIERGDARGEFCVERRQQLSPEIVLLSATGIGHPALHLILENQAASSARRDLVRFSAACCVFCDRGARSRAAAPSTSAIATAICSMPTERRRTGRLIPAMPTWPPAGSPPPDRPSSARLHPSSASPASTPLVPARRHHRRVGSVLHVP